MTQGIASAHDLRDAKHPSALRFFILLLVVLLGEPGVAIGQTLDESRADDSSPVTADRSLREFVAETSYRQGYAIYLRRQKLGWAIEEMRLGEHDGKEVAVYRDESYFTTEFLGEQEVATSTSYVVYSLEDDGAIVYARYLDVEDGREKTTECIAEGDVLKVTTTIGDDVSTRRVPIPKDTLREAQRFQAWLVGDRSRGDQFESWSVSFEDAEVDVLERYEFRRAHELKRDGETLEVFDVDVVVLGGDRELTLTRKGRLLKGSLSGFIDLVAEDDATVKVMDGEPVDLFAAASIQIEQDLGEPDRIRKLVLELRNLGDFSFPKSHRQNVEQREDGVVLLTLRQEHRTDVAEPLTPQEREAYIAATPAIACEHPTIVARAKRVIGKETEALRQAERIVRWVYLNMDAASASNSTNALQVLEERAGDCSEHALLCVALARAVGIPAREVSGVMYAGAGSKFFAWHAWVEVHDGHQWIAVDPTWNQMRVDATHLKFSHDSRDLSWTNVMGKLQVIVKEFETQAPSK